jgi:hypothetical protein
LSSKSKANNLVCCRLNAGATSHLVSNIVHSYDRLAGRSAVSIHKQLIFYSLDPIHKSMVNNRAKCLAISQVIRVKLYNCCLIFSYKKFFYYYVVPCLTFSFLFLLTYTFVLAHRCLCFRVQLVACMRAKLSPLLSHPHQQQC